MKEQLIVLITKDFIKLTNELLIVNKELQKTPEDPIVKADKLEKFMEKYLKSIQKQSNLLGQVEAYTNVMKIISEISENKKGEQNENN